MSNRKKIMKTETAPTPVYYTWPAVPHHMATERSLLKRLWRLKKGAIPCARILLVFDYPRRQRRGSTTLPPAQCEELRGRLAVALPSSEDMQLLDELRRAGQAVEINLFGVANTTQIGSFTEVEAQEMLEAMLFDGSHDLDYITEATVDGERQRRTWKRWRSDPNLAQHLRGQRIFGPKRGESSRLATIDLDRHSGAVSGEDHVALVMDTEEVLTRAYKEMRFAPEVTPKNASTKFFGWAWKWLPIEDAIRLAEEIRAALARELPRHDWSKVEIYPSNSPQVFAPLRPDKSTIIGSGPVQNVERYRYDVVSGKRRRATCQVLSVAQYLNWVHFEQTPPDRKALEQALRAGVAACPDIVHSRAEVEPIQALSTKIGTPASGTTNGNTSNGGMGDLTALKGQCARVLVNFWSGAEIPPDTIGKLLIVTLRILKQEGLSEEEAVLWVEERLLALEDTSFSDRLSSNFEELMRVTRADARRVWDDNGYQADPTSSSAILTRAVAAWDSRGFRFHDPATWGAAGTTYCDSNPSDEPTLTLVWTPRLTALLPLLADLSVTDIEGAKTFLEFILAFVARHCELSESKVGKLLEAQGIKGKSRDKQHHVRKFLVDHGVIVLHKNYVSDSRTNLRHGNYYYLGPEVVFTEDCMESAIDPHTPHHTTPPPVSTYLSFSWERMDEVECRQEARRLECEKRFFERRKRRTRRRNDVSSDQDEVAVAAWLTEAYKECFPE